MSKYTYEEKLEAVLRVENEGMSLRRSAMVIGCNNAEVQKWRDLYREHGPEALLNGGASYDGEFKVMVVEYMHAYAEKNWTETLMRQSTFATEVLLCLLSKKII